MQTQHISDTIPNAISITKIRQDIDALLKLLEKYPKVRVLRGQDVAFEVHRLETDEEKSQRIKRAGESIRQMDKSHVRKPGQKSLTRILIDERDKMRSGAYEL